MHLYGRLEDGSPFLVRDGRGVPHFWIEAGDAARAAQLGAGRQSAAAAVTLAGRPVVRVEVTAPADTPPLRERLQAANIPCYEADVRFAMRYLIDRGIRGALSIEGPSRSVPGLGRVFQEPEVSPAHWAPRLSVLSIDLETDPAARRLLSAALHGCGASEVILLAPPGSACPPGATPAATEAELLALLCRRVRELDPDVITGWNVVGFDMTVLARRAAALGVPLLLGRGPGPLQLRSERGVRATVRASVPGRVVLDGIELLRGAFIRHEDYSLDAVARHVLGEGKTVTGPGRAQEVLRLFEHDRPRLVEYNRTDARLALEILERLELVELAVERSLLTGMPPDRVASSIAAFDFLYLSELRRRGVVAPCVGTMALSEPTGGGHVLEPVAGLHASVAVLDFTSLYPSLIRTFQIDPLNLVRPGVDPGPDPIAVPGAAGFARRPGILPGLLGEIMPRREAAQRAGDRVKSQAIKILMNSFYGVLGTPACRFYDPQLANAITGLGREALLWARERVEAAGHRVLYGDTDSLFVATGEADPAAARRVGEALARGLTEALAGHVAARWRLESRLELRFERLYRQLFFPATRQGGGARKRYAGLVEDGGEGEVAFTGMEAVRGDWTPLARRVQRELYERLFRGRPLEEYLRGIVGELRAGRLDALLVYRKGLRKHPAAYTATTPPHVAAARKLARPPRGRVAYLVTRGGPEPAEAARSPIDHEHYVQKQVRPVAEPVLALLGLDFDRVVGDERQLSLF